MEQSEVSTQERNYDKIELKKDMFEMKIIKLNGLTWSAVKWTETCWNWNHKISFSFIK